MKKPPAIEIVVEDSKWNKIGRNLPGRIESVLARTLAHQKAKGGLTLLLSDDAHLKELNALFRGKKKPTNAISASTPRRPRPRATPSETAMARPPSSSCATT